MDEKEQKTSNPKRVLGDEWEDWNGRDDKALNEGKSLFLAFSFIVVILINVILFVGFYLIEPRLEQIHANLASGVFVAFCLFLVTSFFWTGQMFFTSLTEKNFFFKRSQAFIAFEFLFNRVFKLAGLFKVSRDRVGHSFIKVSNAITHASAKPDLSKGKILILIPRCLQKEQLRQLTDLKNKYPVEVCVVAGGELARKKVKELHPSAIIGVACERDLVSGIRDVAPKIPAIGIINKRPEGPCLNTYIDMEEVERAIKFYLQ